MKSDQFNEYRAQLSPANKKAFDLINRLWAETRLTYPDGLENEILSGISSYVVLACKMIALSADRALAEGRITKQQHELVSINNLTAEIKYMIDRGVNGIMGKSDADIDAEIKDMMRKGRR